jgi:phosphopantetheinyl transferase (holo-ACP synthase)
MEKFAAVWPGFKSFISVLAADYWQLPPQQCGPVAYAATRSSREHLVKQLLAALADRWMNGQSWHSLPLQLSRDGLGQPLLLVAGQPILSVSFSLAGGRTWGALARTGRVGIDVALVSEFPPGYPLWRVFSQEEFDRTYALLGDVSWTAALLWSVKEAAVKALGVGFNYLAPGEIVIGSGKSWRQGLLFEVDAGSRVKAWARLENEGWLALALTE